MAKKRPPLPKYNTPIGTARYPHLNTPDTRFDDDGVYKCDHIAPADSEETQQLIERLEGIVDKTFEEELDAKQKKQFQKAPVCEVELDEAGDETGNVIFKTKLNAIGRNKKTGEEWENKPKLFDSQGNPLPETVEIWSGSKIIIAGSVRPYVVAATKKVGVTLRCNGVQVIELVTRGGATADSFGFGKYDDGYQTDAAQAGFGNSSETEDDTPEDDDDEF